MFLYGFLFSVWELLWNAAGLFLPTLSAREEKPRPAEDTEPFRIDPGLLDQLDDRLEHELLLKQQNPAAIRALIDEVVNNADSAKMDLRSVAQLHAEAEAYLDLLSSNTALLGYIGALEALPAEEATAESWSELWSEKVGTLKQLTVVSSLSDSKKKERYIHTLDNLLNRYTVEHSNPLEYAFICTISRSNGLAVLCIAIAFILDLSGLAAFEVVKRAV